MARPRKHPTKPTPESESRRVAAYRKRLMQEEHFRSVSFLASPEEFSRIEAARERTGLSTKELMLARLDWLMSEAAETPEDDLELLIADDDQAAPALNPARELLARGELFDLPGRQDYVLLSLYLNLERLPGLFPFDTELIRDFGTYREALQYDCLRRDRLPPAHELLLLGRLGADELSGVAGEHLYRVRLRLRGVYPQIAEYADGKDYQQVFQTMRAEYADEL